MSSDSDKLERAQRLSVRSSPTAPILTGFSRSPTTLAFRLHDESHADVESGIDRLRDFAQRLLERITEYPVSFEVFADDADEMRGSATVARGRERLSEDPITTTSGVDGAARSRALRVRRQGDVTAMFTLARSS